MNIENTNDFLFLRIEDILWNNITDERKCASAMNYNKIIHQEVGKTSSFYFNSLIKKEHEEYESITCVQPEHMSLSYLESTIMKREKDILHQDNNCLNNEALKQDDDCLDSEALKQDNKSLDSEISKQNSMHLDNDTLYNDSDASSHNSDTLYSKKSNHITTTATTTTTTSRKRRRTVTSYDNETSQYLKSVFFEVYSYQNKLTKQQRKEVQNKTGLASRNITYWFSNHKRRFYHTLNVYRQIVENSNGTVNNYNEFLVWRRNHGLPDQITQEEVDEYYLENE